MMKKQLKKKGKNAGELISFGRLIQKGLPFREVIKGN